MTQDLAVAGKDLWADLDRTLSRSAAGESEVFSPDFCDLREELKDPESEPLREVVQHLRDLGYLKPLLDENGNEIMPGPEDEEKLARALELCYADLDSFEILFRYHLSPGESGEPKNVFRDAVLENRLKEPLVVKFSTIVRLRALTSLDGKVEFLGEPKMGETSLRTRVLHYLLRIYGVLPDDFDASSAYTGSSLRALRSLRSLRGVKADETTLLNVMNELNQFDAVAETFAKQFEDASIWIPAPKTGDDWSDSLKTQMEQWKAIREKPLPTRVVEVGAFETNDGAAWSPPNWNLFGIRFLQVYLWYRGHYFGEIDGLWGPLSQAAFISALEAHHLPAEPLKKWRDSNHEGYWMASRDYYYLDVSSFIRASSQTTAPQNAKSPDDIFKMQEAIDDRLDKLGATEAERRKAWEQVFAKVAEDEDSSSGRRRWNFSLGMIGRGIQRILNVVQRAWKYVENFVKTVLETIRGAVRQAFRFLQRILEPALNIAKLTAQRVIRMFTGAPYVHAASGSRWVLTKFSLDQDAMTLGGPALLAEDVEAHFALIQDENRALEVVVRLGVKVLEMVSLFTPPLTGLAAMALVWKVLRTVWDIFRDLQAPFERESAPWRTGMLMAT